MFCLFLVANFGVGSLLQPLGRAPSMGCTYSKISPPHVASVSVRTTPKQSAVMSLTEPPADKLAQVIDGKGIADGVVDKLRRQVAKLPTAPMLVVVLVGAHPASLSYIKRKEAAAAECGIRTRLLQLAETISQQELLEAVNELNDDDDVDGIIVQLPLPAHLDAKAATGGVAAVKDVDGFLPFNVGATALNGHEPLYCPCTPKGCMQLIESAGVPLRGKEACVIGASNIVGLPMGMLLLKAGCNGCAPPRPAAVAPLPPLAHDESSLWTCHAGTVTTCHIDTVDVPFHSRRADVLVVAVGQPEMVRADWVKPGAIIIDVGINFVPDATKKSGQRIVGDVDYAGVREVAGYVTPVPGGVGPMTVAMLMSNTVDACRRRRTNGKG